MFCEGVHGPQELVAEPAGGEGADRQCGDLGHEECCDGDSLHGVSVGFWVGAVQIGPDQLAEWRGGDGARCPRREMAEHSDVGQRPMTARARSVLALLKTVGARVSAEALHHRVWCSDVPRDGMWPVWGRSDEVQLEIVAQKWSHQKRGHEDGPIVCEDEGGRHREGLVPGRQCSGIEQGVPGIVPPYPLRVWCWGPPITRWHPASLGQK